MSALQVQDKNDTTCCAKDAGNVKVATHGSCDWLLNVGQENMGAGFMEAIPVAESIQAIPVPALPPYNGFGSFEDSEQSCKNLVSPSALLPSSSVHDCMQGIRVRLGPPQGPSGRGCSSNVQLLATHT